MWDFSFGVLWDLVLCISEFTFYEKFHNPITCPYGRGNHLTNFCSLLHQNITSLQSNNKVFQFWNEKWILTWMPFILMRVFSFTSITNFGAKINFFYEKYLFSFIYFSFYLLILIYSFIFRTFLPSLAAASILQGSGFQIV